MWKVFYQIVNWNIKGGAIIYADYNYKNAKYLWDNLEYKNNYQLRKIEILEDTIK